MIRKKAAAVCFCTSTGLDWTPNHLALRAAGAKMLLVYTCYSTMWGAHRIELKQMNSSLSRSKKMYLVQMHLSKFQNIGYRCYNEKCCPLNKCILFNSVFQRKEKCSLSVWKLLRDWTLLSVYLLSLPSDAFSFNLLLIEAEGNWWKLSAQTVQITRISFEKTLHPFDFQTLHSCRLTERSFYLLLSMLLQ